MATLPPKRCSRLRSTAEPSPVQARIIKYIALYRGAHGYSPTLQEIADHLGRTKVTVLEHIRALRRKGLVSMQKRHFARQLRLTGRWLPPASCELPEKPSDIERQLSILAAACQEVLLAARSGGSVRRKLEDALQTVETCLSSAPLPSVA